MTGRAWSEDYNFPMFAMRILAFSMKMAMGLSREGVSLFPAL